MKRLLRTLYGSVYKELRENKRRPTKADRQGLFSGLVNCADCGSKLHFATCKSFDDSQDHYRCARYKSNTGSCTAHFIREETLRKIVRQRIFDVTALFYENITAFMELLHKRRFHEADKEMKCERKEVGQAKKRIAELDRIFKRIYEDDISISLLGDDLDHRAFPVESCWSLSNKLINLVPQIKPIQIQTYPLPYR